MVADPRDARLVADPYATLGVDPTASADDVRRAYRRLARALHPDASPGDTAAVDRFHQVTLAYELLRDPLRRTALDRHRRDAAGPRPIRVAPAPSGNTAVRGPAARPAHQPHEVTSEPAPRSETDEWALLGRFLRWGVAAVVTAIATIAIVAAMVAPSGSTPHPPRSVGVPGGTGFCQTADGWVSCRHVQVREP